MKSRIKFLCIFIMVLCLSFSKDTIAQQPQAKAAEQSASQMHNGQQGASYTYRIFEAPSYMFGYDIYQNGKGIFHQPAAMVPPNNVTANQQSPQQNLHAANNTHATENGFSKKEFAENAALLSIEKIKKKSSPVLTSDEMKQVVINKISASTQKN